MGINKVNYGGNTLIDLTGDTVTPSALAEGVTAHNAAGEVIRGTMPTSTVLYTAQTLSDDQKSQARDNIKAAGRFYGVCSTAAGTVAKTVTVDGSFSLEAGVQITVKFSNANSASSPTLNVNETGAKPIYRYGTTVVSTGTTTTGWVAGAIQTFTYDGAGWIRDYWSNTTYSNVSLGQGYATCTTAAATVAKTATLSSYALTTGGIVAVKFSEDVPAGATLNVYSKGAKAIYHKGAAITDGVINAGDTATFIYSTYYHLLSVDRVNDVVSVKDYGAKGNNSTDDTTAFQNALANERVVYVPGGKYKLSGELIIRGNCQLELAQDAVLYFSQTFGNCISMEASAFIKGNHATVSVPYGFSGNVIYVDSQLNQTIASIPPFTKWDPQWKTGRYLTDLNIIKTDSRGFCYSVNGDCSGIAIYITCNDNTSIATDSNSIWGLNFSGVRIAGAFSYGIKAKNFNGTWNHEMRIEAFIDACEIGVGLEDCKNSYISATIQPRTALSLSEVETAYAKHGIELIRSRNVDLSGSRVWDWNEVKSLWTEYNKFQHLALIGDCKGTILNEYCYYATPEYDVRNNIYTDTSSNLDCLVIVQEPFTRWFKPIEDTPYFYDGDFTERLIGEQELSEILDAERTKNYTNALSTAKDTDGSVFYGKGYVRGKRVNPSSGEMVEGTSYGCTGFIPVSRNTTIYAKALYLDETAGNTGAVLYNSSFTRIIHVNAANLVPNKSTSYFTGYEATEKGFKVTVADTASTNNVAYIRFTFKREHIGFKPVISVGNPITYTTSGYLQDSIKVKTANVEGLSEILGSYINDVDVLLGGG